MFALLEEHHAVIGVGDTALSVPSENPRCDHTVAPAIVYLQSHVGQFKFLRDLPDIGSLALILLRLINGKLDDLFKPLEYPLFHEV